MVRRNNGVSVIYTIIAMSAICGLLSLAVDLGRVHIAKSELQQASDAAARYAATGLASNTAVSKAVTSALDNKADGISVVVNYSDVQTGNWKAALTPKFSTTRTPTNAVQVNASRSSARSNAIPLLFAGLIGRNSCDIHVTSIAKIGPRIPLGFIGLQGMTVNNNLTSASYDSALNANPNSSSYKNSGMIGSNTSITAKNNDSAGFVVLGPSATTNLTLPTPPTVLTSPIPTPVLDFSAAPATNPGGISKNLVVNSTTTLAGGTYYFTSITMGNNSSLRFSGPATLYIDGNVTFSQSGAITAFGSLPANLLINQRGAGTIFGGPTANNVDITAVITAPQTDFVAWNGSALKGSAIFNTITAKNNAEFYYDENLELSLPGAGTTVMIVK